MSLGSADPAGEIYCNFSESDYLQTMNSPSPIPSQIFTGVCLRYLAILTALGIFISLSGVSKLWGGIEEQSKSTGAAKKVEASRQKAKVAPPKKKAALFIKKATDTNEIAKVEITGSHIRQKVKQIGRTTDTASPVLIISRKDIEESGAATIGEVLRRFPVFF